MAAVLEDGSYDAIVVDAEAGSTPETVALELAVAAGPHRGEVVAVTARDLGRDPLDLLAVPATIVVLDGAPTLTLEG